MKTTDQAQSPIPLVSDPLTPGTPNAQLIAAAAKGTLNDVRRALSAGAYIGTAGIYRDAMTDALLAAVLHNDDPKVAAFFLEEGLDRAARSHFNTPLAVGLAWRGWSDLLDVALTRGAPLSEFDTYGQSALTVAAGFNAVECLKVLLRHGADINLRGHANETALHHAASGEVADLLLNAGADSEARDDSLRTPIMDAIEHEYIDVIKVLGSRGANFEATNSDGQSALFIAVAEGKVLSLEALLDAGAKVETTDAALSTPLIAAAESGNVELLKRLVERGANIEAQDRAGGTALHYAALNGNTAAFIFLLDAGANTQARNHRDDGLEAMLSDQPEVAAAYNSWRARASMTNITARICEKSA